MKTTAQLLKETAEQLKKNDRLEIIHSLHEGDIVIDKNLKSIHEILSIGTNYITVVDLNGDMSKKWVSDIILANSLKEDFKEHSRKRCSKKQVAFKGYKTTHFTEEITDIFREMLKDKEFKENAFLTLSLIRSTDKLVGLVEEGLTINAYNHAKALYEQTEKLLDKLPKSVYHSYRNDIFESLIMIELVEGLNPSLTDKKKIASIIATSFGSDASGDAVEIINAAAQKLKGGKHTPEAWKIAGNMLNMATKAGIKWDKSIFSAPTAKAMGIV